MKLSKLLYLQIHKKLHKWDIYKFIKDLACLHLQVSFVQLITPHTFGWAIPRASKSSGCFTGSSITSLISLICLSRPPTISYVESGTFSTIIKLTSGSTCQEKGCINVGFIVSIKCADSRRSYVNAWLKTLMKCNWSIFTAHSPVNMSKHES